MATDVLRSGSLAVRPLLLAAASLGSLACGEEHDRPPPLGSARPIAGCEDFSYRTCDILTERCQRELFALMACLHGDSGETVPPPVRLLDEETALSLVSDPGGTTEMMTEGLDAMSGMAEDERAFLAEVRALELLGMLTPDLIETPEDVAAVTVSSLLAYYLIPTREIVIIDRGEPVANLEANAVLAHEYVHALQDRRHGLGTFGADLVTDSDANLALSSLIEGEATLYQYLITFAYRGADLDYFNFGGFFAELARFAENATREAGSPAITAGSIFPYTFGARYVGESWVLGGNAAIESRYQSPPVTTWEVLQSPPPGASVARFEQSPAPVDGSTLLGDDVAGAWVVVAALTGQAPQERPEEGEALAELARHWRGDRYWVFATGDEAPRVTALWAIEWDDAATAERFSSMAAALAPLDAVSRIDTAGTSTLITATERAEELETWRERLAEAAAAGP